MKRFGNAVKVSALMCVALLAVFALAGCGDDKASEGGTKSYSQNETLGDAGVVVVKSDKEFDADQQAVINQLAEFGDATESKDYEKICNELLTEKSAELGGDCEKSLSKSGEDIKSFKITVTDVTIDEGGKSATAQTITDVNGEKGTTQPIKLIKGSDGKWRVAILGE